MAATFQSQFFHLPREIKTMIYDYASGDNPKFSSFEIPWAFGRYVREDKSTETCLEEEARGLPLSTADQNKTTVMKHRMAFTCREVLVEVMDDYTTYNNGQVVVGFVAGMAYAEITELAPGDTPKNIWLDKEERRSKLVQLLLSKKLPAEARVRIHLSQGPMATRAVLPSLNSFAGMLRYFSLTNAGSTPPSPDEILRQLTYIAELEFAVADAGANLDKKERAFDSIRYSCNECLKEAHKLRQVKVFFKGEEKPWVLVKVKSKYGGDDWTWEADADTVAEWRRVFGWAPLRD